MLLNSLSFCLSVKVLISPSNLNESLAGSSNMVGGFFLSSHQVYHATPFWPAVSAEKSADNLIEVPLHIVSFPSCFHYFLFDFNFVQLD